MSQAKLKSFVCAFDTSVDVHISHFYNLEQQISVAIENEDELHIVRLDHEIKECWITLLETVPADKDDALALIEFFLDQLCNNVGLGQLSSQARERIIFLAKTS